LATAAFSCFRHRRAVVRLGYSRPPLLSWRRGQLFTSRNQTGSGLSPAAELLAGWQGTTACDGIATPARGATKTPASAGQAGVSQTRQAGAH